MRKLHQISRWLARILGVVLISVNIAMLVGSGWSPTQLSMREQWMVISLLTGIVGMGLGWRKDFIGGICAIAGYVGLVLSDERFPNPGWFNPLLAMIGIDGFFYIYSGFLRLKLEQQSIQ